MPNTIPTKISAAYWTHPNRGCVLLEHDFGAARHHSGHAGHTALPPLTLFSPNLEMRNLRVLEPLQFGKVAGYCRRGDAIVFCVDPQRYPYLDFTRDGLFVQGDFNGWQTRKEWGLKKRHDAREGEVWELALSFEQLRSLCGGEETAQAYFKFITASGDWLPPCFEAPNRMFDADGNCNYQLDFGRTGAHAFQFDVEGGRTFVGEHVLVWREDDYEQHVTPQPGLDFFHLKSELPQGVRIEAAASVKAGSQKTAKAAKTEFEATGTTADGGVPAAEMQTPAEVLPTAEVQTVFRLFAPRATAVTLELMRTLDKSRLPVLVEMELAEDLLTWEARLPGNLHGTFYQYRIEGEVGVLNAFNPQQPVLDPYALATVSERGPGIVVDRAQLPRIAGQGQPHQPPRYEDALIVECHVRDLLANAPVELSAAERRGFAGLTRWLDDPHCYLRQLGTNVVELQPCQQFDSQNAEEYHWGYMTTNFFAPCCWYARKPKLATGEGSAIGDFAALAAALHAQNLSLVLDVVYNHVGEPAHLALIDKYYYFVVDPVSGEFDNASGCGNTLRADAAMSRHLMIESLRHLVRTFDIDGMRFDLAELIGIGALYEIEIALRKEKPSLIFIAEPWSFRGTMGRDLHHSSYAFWNDGFREFAADYLRGGNNADGLHYYVLGSTGHAALWPSQSVNYVASHDDMCWPDKITENENHDATDPTPNDRTRTHLAAALTFLSNGIPMWPQGLDFLHSKQGVNNTYLRGDLNALDYERAIAFAGSVAYMRGWIAFRQGEWGELLRLKQNASPEYLYRFNANHGTACALLFNADRSLGPRRLLFAINPCADEAATILLPPDLDVRHWNQFANHERFCAEGFGVAADLCGVGNAIHLGKGDSQPATDTTDDAPAAPAIHEGSASCYPPRVWTYFTAADANAPGALVLPPLSCCLFGS